ncbi:MAG: adenylate kinase [Dehalococcoidia bacterium]|nr:adenylate kinase [Dehalococcoidia bacterium]
MYVLLLGAPGAGKGTQAASISKELSVPHVASGDLFREAINSGSELGQIAKSYYDQGKLVPDAIAIRMVMARLEMDDCHKGCLLDGFPRTVSQAEALDNVFVTEKKGIDRVIYMKVSTGELLRRLSGRWICRNCQTPYHMVTSPPKTSGKCDHCGGELYQRSDDTSETARRRLDVYFAETEPLINYYKKQGKLKEVDGEKSIEAVGQSVSQAIK